MAECNIDQLLADACSNQFLCLEPGSQTAQAVKNQLLCNLISAIESGAGGSDWDSEIVKSSDQSVENNDTPQDDTELFSTLDADGFYLINLLLLYSGTTSDGDYKFWFTYPTADSAPTGCVNGWNGPRSAVLNSGTSGSLTVFPTLGFVFGTVDNNKECAFVQFLLQVGGSGGTLQYQFANSSAGLARISTTRAGTTLRIKKLN
jgi:hypothetical protein